MDKSVWITECSSCNIKLEVEADTEQGAIAAASLRHGMMQANTSNCHCNNPRFVSASLKSLAGKAEDGKR